jgi:hypothetical protein
MTETERNDNFNKYEPVFGKPGVSWFKVLCFRIGQLLFVDMPSKASVFVWISTWMAWKLLDKGKLVSDVAVIAVVGLMALAWLNWCMRKYVGPLMEAIASWLSKGKTYSANNLTRLNAPSYYNPLKISPAVLPPPNTTPIEPSQTIPVDSDIQ